MPKDQYNCEKCGVAHKEGTKVYADHKQFRKAPEVSAPAPPVGITADDIVATLSVSLVKTPRGNIPVPSLRGTPKYGEIDAMLKVMMQYIQNMEVVPSENNRRDS